MISKKLKKRIEREMREDILVTMVQLIHFCRELEKKEDGEGQKVVEEILLNTNYPLQLISNVKKIVYYYDTPFRVERKGKNLVIKAG